MESPKVMGLMGIHNPNALWHYQPLEDNPLQARPCVQPVFWLPNSDVRLTLPAWVPKLSMVQCPFWIGSVQLTHLPNHEFIQGSKGGAIQPDPLPSGRPGDLTKKVLLTSPPNPSFILQPCRQDNYFHSSCDLNCFKNDTANNVKHTHPN